MALRFVDSFDHYNTAQIERKWNVSEISAVIASSPVRTGVGALRLDSASGSVSRTTDDRATWIVGFGFRTNNVASHIFFRFVDVGTTQVGLRLNSDGTLEVLRGTSSAVSGGLSVLTLSVNTWYYIEIKVTIANSIAASSCEVQVDGVSWLTVDAGEDLQDTANASANVIKFVGLVATQLLIDDLYICDDTGSKNNDFLGPVNIDAFLPDGEGAQNQFTGSDGNSVDNHLLVNENTANDDTTYVESNTVAHNDLYTFPDLIGVPEEIFGLQVNVIAKKEDAGSRKLKALSRPTSVTIEGDVIHWPSDESYANFEQIWEDDPQATAAWTFSTFNAAEFGVTIEA